MPAVFILGSFQYIGICFFVSDDEIYVSDVKFIKFG